MIELNKQTNNLLANCRIILVNTTHPGNVGATARAMKTMGLSELYLVNDNCEIIDDHAIARASGATDVLARAKIVPSLEEAVAGCNYLIGTSDRERALSNPVMAPNVGSQKAINDYVANGYKIAVIFGQERIGLTNKELSYCHDQIVIPANSDYSSLNISSAVQIVCYELRLAALQLASQHDLVKTAKNMRDNDVLADCKDVELFYNHLERLMYKTDFLDPKQPKLLMQRLRRLFNRAQLCQQELNIMRGILSACEKKSDLADSFAKEKQE